MSEPTDTEPLDADPFTGDDWYVTEEVESMVIDACSTLLDRASDTADESGPSLARLMEMLLATVVGDGWNPSYQADLIDSIAEGAKMILVAVNDQLGEQDTAGNC